MKIPRFNERNLLIFTILFFIIFILLTQLVMAQKFNSQGVPIDANGNIDWNYLQNPPPASAANLMDKLIYEIDDCYNVSVHIKLVDGNKTPVTFKDCTSVTANKWTCDCKATIGTYNLTMQTDQARLDSDEARWYEIEIKYSTYSIEKYEDSYVVKDHGDYIDISDHTANDLGKNIIYIPGETIYVEKNVTQIVYQDRPVDRFVDRPVYFENTTHIEQLQQNLTSMTNLYNASHRANNYITYIAIFQVIILLALGIIYIWRKRVKSEPIEIEPEYTEPGEIEIVDMGEQR